MLIASGNIGLINSPDVTMALMAKANSSTRTHGTEQKEYVLCLWIAGLLGHRHQVLCRHILVRKLHLGIIVPQAEKLDTSGMMYRTKDGQCAP